MGVYAEYKQKLVSPQRAVEVVCPGHWLDYGFCAGHPVALDKALAARMSNDPALTDLNFRGGVALWQPEVTKLPDAERRITWNSWHCSSIERQLMGRGFVFYAPIRFSETPRYYRENIGHVDVAMFQVAPMDEKGFFSFGVSATHLTALCECAGTVIVEVNRNMPSCRGKQAGIHISGVDFIVEGGDPAMGQMAAVVPSETDQAVAQLIVPHIPNGACIQLGIGGMPNAVGSLIARSDLRDLGVHTEIYVDSFMEMGLAGKLNGAKKSLHRGREVFSFAAGTQKLYDYIDANPAFFAAPVDYVNDVRVVSALDNMISINNVIEVDLFGQAASESYGTRHISGAGGQLDFVLGSYLSKGGKSFLCCSSTVTEKDGTLKSRITPTITPGGIVTSTRANVQYVVTEFGMVNLKGLSTWQRAEALISIAHPMFRQELTEQAQALGIWRGSHKR